MKLKGTVSVLCITGLLAATLAGCGSSASGSSTSSSAGAGSASSASTSTSAEAAGSTLSGQVQSVTGDSLTLLLGGGPDKQGGGGPDKQGGGGPDKQGGTAPSGQTPPTSGTSSSQKSTSDQTSQPSQPPQLTSGSSADPGSSGKGGSAPAQGDNNSGAQTVTISMNDSTVVKVQGTSGESDGTVDDIAEGAFVEVTMGENNTAATVVVKPSASAPTGQNQPSSGSAKDSASETGQAATSSASAAN